MARRTRRCLSPRAPRARTTARETSTAARATSSGRATSIPGLAVWQQTAHSRALARADGTKITCSICHEPHGSNNTALVVEQLAPPTPSVADTVAVPANDRWLCYGCHANAQAKYPGGLVHQTSAHGSTTQTVPVGTEWATRLPVGSPATERLVGECQTCHAPHGVDDGSGAPIAKLLKAKGTALCYTCHGTGSTIATDMQSMDPTVAAGVPEVIVGFGASASTVQFGRVQVYSRQTAAQATLDQAREFLTGGIGPVTTGDFDGDGVPELLVARDGAATLTAMTASALSGLRDDPGDMLLLGPADHMVLADVIDDINNRPEIVTAQGTTLRFYRWNGVSLGLVGSLSTSGTITGLARGNILGTDRDEVAVTTNAPDGLLIVTGTTGDAEYRGAVSHAAAAERPLGGRHDRRRTRRDLGRQQRRDDRTGLGVSR